MPSLVTTSNNYVRECKKGEEGKRSKAKEAVLCG